MKICIIGCGYVGKNAAREWKSQGHEITVTARSLERAYQLRPLADLVYILTNDWRDLLEKQDLVLLSVAPDRGGDYYETYLRSSEKLVAALQSSSVSQIIYTSSTSVYGEHHGEWVDENTPPKPAHAKAQILLDTEETLLKASSPSRKVCIYRLGEIYGPGRSLIDKVEQIQGVVLPGTGQAITNLIHLKEIQSALNIALVKGLQGIYNLCNDRHIPRKDLYRQICTENGWKDPLWDAKMVSPHGGNKKVNNEKIKAMGWAALN